MKKIAALFLFLVSLPAFAVPKSELTALRTLSIQLQADKYRFTVEEVLLDNYKGKDALIVYVYDNAHAKKLATIPKKVGNLPVVLQKIPVIVYYIDDKGHLVIP